MCRSGHRAGWFATPSSCPGVRGRYCYPSRQVNPSGGADGDVEATGREVIERIGTEGGVASAVGAVKKRAGAHGGVAAAGGVAQECAAPNGVAAAGGVVEECAVANGDSDEVVTPPGPGTQSLPGPALPPGTPRPHGAQSGVVRAVLARDVCQRVGPDAVSRPAAQSCPAHAHGATGHQDVASARLSVCGRGHGAHADAAPCSRRHVRTTPGGHPRRAAVPPDTPLALAPPSGALRSGSPARRSTPAAERRQLTVMFCDVVDSTTLAGQLDPEDFRAVMVRYHATCTEVIERYGGHVAQYLGDGLLVYFGWPQAHEDDARRAVHAGLALVTAVRDLGSELVQDYGMRLAIRIGMHTGLVVVGTGEAGTVWPVSRRGHSQSGREDSGPGAHPRRS